MPRNQKPPPEAMILPLAGLDADGLALAGGKAVNLGELMRAGFAVPRGFCLTTQAYAQVAAAVACDPGDPAATRDGLRAAPVPPAVSEALARAYRELGADIPVAVRSSATAEDLPHASFAGQQDTFLNVVGVEALLDAVRCCWASLWTDRAVSYRERAGIDHAAVRLAVVVQVMVDAQVAGVLFTANPVTGRRRQAVIDASPGLGEVVVSGAVNPDHFVVDLSPPGWDSRSALTPEGGAIVERRPSLQGTETCLDDEQVRSLAVLGQRVEEHFGAPQDIEWAIAQDGGVWLVQARPITSLFPLPEDEGVSGPLHVWFSVNVAQGVFRPLTPMALSVFQLLTSAFAALAGHAPRNRSAGHRPVGEAGGRLFLDLAPALRNRFGRMLLPRAFGIGEARSAALLTHLVRDPRLALVPGSSRRFLRRLVTIVARLRMPVTIFQALRDPEAFQIRTAALPERIRALARAEADDPVTAIERLVEKVYPRVARIAPVLFTSIGLFGLAARLLGTRASAEELDTVRRSLPHNVTTEMDLRLWALARRLHEDADACEQLLGTAPGVLAARYHAGELAPTLQAGLGEFLRVYGHRAIAEIDLGLPRWSEDPTHILGVLTNYLRLKAEDRAADAQFEHGRQAAEAMVAELEGRARARGRLRGAAVGFCLRRARALAGVRETPKFCAVLMFSEIRRLLRGVGERLATDGRLDAAADVFFLRLGEVRTALAGEDLRGLVAERRADYERELRRRHVPRILLSDGTEPEAVFTAAAPAEGLAGTPASAGVATGVARVVLEPTGAHLEPGEILVAPSTDPGWTPLFLTAGGLVMEMGGAMSHGAVVAREYGIPAVVGVPGATERIASGQTVTIDGSAGTVTVTAPEAA